jgi:hypothetical protein
MPTDNKRLLLEFSSTVSQLNREILNPAIPELAIEDLKPVMSKVAEARASYLTCLFEACKQADLAPDHKLMGELKEKREFYEELRAATLALENAIEREYLDVKAS